MEMLLEIISLVCIPVILNKTQNFQGCMPSRAACHNVDKSFQCQFCRDIDKHVKMFLMTHVMFANYYEARRT